MLASYPGFSLRACAFVALLICLLTSQKLFCLVVGCNAGYVNVGNHPCPKSGDTVPDAQTCAKAAEELRPGGGCYGVHWSKLVQTVNNTNEPKGCYFFAAAGGGCALLFNPHANASSVCLSGLSVDCEVICRADKEPASCAAHSKCKGRVGSCCPTIRGVMLECCSPDVVTLVV